MLQLDFIVSRKCDVTCKDATQSAPFAGAVKQKWIQAGCIIARDAWIRV